MSVLVTGVAGSLAARVALALSDDRDVVGLDTRPLRQEFGGTYVQVKRYNSRPTVEVFRKHRPTTLVHLGIRGFSPHSLTRRYTENVLGTKSLLDLAVKYGVKRVVVLSTYHVYGAHQHNPINIREDAPLRASQNFPELVDSVELDHLASTFLWQHRDIGTMVLRPVNIVGPSIRNRMSRLLRTRPTPKLFGYDPMVQFLHEDDARRAILTAVNCDAHGVFNVAGEGTVAWSHAVSLAGSYQLVLPRSFVGLLDRKRRKVFPRHLRDFFRYPVVLDDRAFRRATGFAPVHDTVATLASVAHGADTTRIPVS
jgi:UDP-glucose 4-epimerase